MNSQRFSFDVVAIKNLKTVRYIMNHMFKIRKIINNYSTFMKQNMIRVIPYGFIK